MAQFPKLFPDGTGEPGGTFALVGPFAVVQFGREQQQQRQQQFVQICMKFVKAHKIVERLLRRLQHMAQGCEGKGRTEADFEFEFESENEIN